MISSDQAIRETERYLIDRGFGKLSKQMISSDQAINSHGSYITCLIIQAQRFGDTWNKIHPSLFFCLLIAFISWKWISTVITSDSFVADTFPLSCTRYVKKQFSFVCLFNTLWPIRHYPSLLLSESVVLSHLNFGFCWYLSVSLSMNP